MVTIFIVDVINIKNIILHFFWFYKISLKQHDKKKTEMEFLYTQEEEKEMILNNLSTLFERRSRLGRSKIKMHRIKHIVQSHPSI